MRSTTSILAGAAAALMLILSACTEENPAPRPSFGATPAPTDSLDFTMRSFMNQGAVAVIAEVRWPGGTWSRAYGVRELDAGQPATTGDRVSVASVDDVARAVREDMSTQRGLKLTAALPWEANDVGSFRYSDSNYLALGQLLEKLRGKPVAQVLRDDVINRLGLGATSLDQPVRGEPDMIHGYITLRGERLDITQPPADLGSPAFGAISAMHDVNDFFEALFRGDLVSDTAVKEMTTTGSFPYYGLGLWKWHQGCTDDYRFGGQGAFPSYRTTAISSTDGQQQATMTLVPPPIPTPLEDPASEDKLKLWDGQMASALQETLDRLC